MECRNSALCVFDKPSFQTDILKTTYVEYFPVSTIDSEGPIEFFIPGAADDYLDLNDTCLKVVVKLKKADGKAIDTATDKCAFTNLAIASIFSDCATKISDVQISGGDFDYGYTSYLLTALQFQKQAQKTHLKVWGWMRDEAEKFDDNANDGHVERMSMVDKSKAYELYGPLFTSITRQDRFLLSSTDIRIKLSRASPKFACMSFNGTPLKIDIEKCSLFIRRVAVNPSVIEGHSVGLSKRNAIYPIPRYQLTSHIVTAGQLETLKDNLFPVETPKLLLVGMVEHTAFNGDYKKNPYNFQHFDLNKLVLYCNGEIVHGHALMPDYDNDQYTAAYTQTMSALKYFNTDDSNGITYEEFKNGYNIYAFDLTSDNNASATYRNGSADKGLGLEVKFANALKQNVNLLIFGMFDSHFELTKLRNVIVDHYGG